MGFARRECAVVLIGDIDRGGVIAQSSDKLSRPGDADMVRAFSSTSFARRQPFLRCMELIAENPVGALGLIRFSPTPRLPAEEPWLARRETSSGQDIIASAAARISNFDDSTR